eukprot:12797491-Prorocentrum_lima.AAC.1
MGLLGLSYVCCAAVAATCWTRPVYGACLSHASEEADRPLDRLVKATYNSCNSRSNSGCKLP